jgi:N-acetylglucosamine-6-phosphate deacetylase
MSATEITGRDPRTGHPIAVIVEGGKIAHVVEIRGESEFCLSAGFVDLQVNGCAGLDLNAGQVGADTVAGLVDAMLARGVTCFVPTVITAPEEEICGRLRAIATACRANPKTAACVPFIHVEGPHISPLDGYRGAHPADSVRPPSLAEFERWQAAAEGRVGMVTLSPHFDESEEYIAELVRRRVRVALGHTHATPEQIGRAVDAGASLSTHLGNGIAQEIPRHRNPIWKQLADERLIATFIADGHHLPPDVLKAMLAAKGVARSVLVSDSVALAGMPAGVYATGVGGKVELRPDGRLCLFGSDLLAGSTVSLAQCLGRVTQMTGISRGDALAMITANPGRLVGGRGELAVGARADLVRFRWEEEAIIEDVWLAGQRVYASQAMEAGQ